MEHTSDNLCSSNRRSLTNKLVSPKGIEHARDKEREREGWGGGRVVSFSVSSFQFFSDALFKQVNGQTTLCMQAEDFASKQSPICMA